MSVNTKEHYDKVIKAANSSDEIIVISGYFTADIIEDMAKTGASITFYYGMFNKNGISSGQYNSFDALEKKYANLKINVVTNISFVHSKLYIFKKNGLVTDILMGSANATLYALKSDDNCELLIDVTNTADITDLLTYSATIDSVSVHFDDPYVQSCIRVTTAKKGRIILKGKRVYSGNPLVDNIPLYNIKNGKKVVELKSGLNWGLQGGKTGKYTYAPAYIPIDAWDIDTYPLMFFPLGGVGSGTGGKKTRTSSPVTVTWNHNGTYTTMPMHFEGKGVQRPTAGKRLPNAPFQQFPKQLTTDGHGEDLGRYLRTLLGVSGTKLITYNDLKKYGRDYVTLRYIAPGQYEIDF